jgi:hypothetical protein
VRITALISDRAWFGVLGFGIRRADFYFSRGAGWDGMGCATGAVHPSSGDCLLVYGRIIPAEIHLTFDVSLIEI